MSLALTTPLSRGDSVPMGFPDITKAMPFENRSIYIFGPRGDTWESCTQWFTTIPGAFGQACFLFFTLGYMAGGSNSVAVIYMHVCNAIAFLSMLVWASIDICAPDIVIWSLGLIAVAVVQIVRQVLQSRKLAEILEAPGFNNLFFSRFASFDVSQQLFADLVTLKGCESATLKKGQSYALESKTRVDRVSIILSGRLSVYCKEKFLHFIGSNTFVDSPEWDSMNKNGNEKLLFKVSITADCDCQLITWKRKGLVAFLEKRKRFGMIFQHMIGRDITSKLESLNDRQMTPRGFRYDIRLPCIISLVQDIKRRQRQQSTPATPGSPVDAEGRKQKHKRMGKTAAAKYSNILAAKIQENKAKGRTQLLKH